jgi:NAD(P)-dependent dehydrogenase (short-subunit alcohol dehydrogenase family)
MTGRKDRTATLDGKVVVITGAGSGIGRALAREAAWRGAVLAISDVDTAGLEETARLVREATGQEVRVDKLDVRDREAWAGYAASLVEQHGRVNVVVNNAGVALSGHLTEVTWEQFDQVMEVDFDGVLNGTKTFLPHLIASGDGYLVNISSLFGLMAVPGQAAYNAAKFGVRGLTEAVRQEMKVASHPVRVSCVHPGGIRTAIARNAAAADGIDQRASARFFDDKLARTSAEDAARTILDGMLADRARILVGRDAHLLDKLVRITGAGYQRLVTATMARAERRLRG